MGVATLDGRSFRLDPRSVKWTFRLKTAVQETVGGRVVQVLGTSMSDLVIEGFFGVGGWEEQAIFLEQMKEIGRTQAAQAAVRNFTGNPMRFLYSPRGWDFLVYLKAFAQPDGPGTSVWLAPEVLAPRWVLTLFVVEDNAGLRRVASDAFIARLAAGLGWKSDSPYNGPLSPNEVQSTLSGAGATTIQDYVAKFGIGSQVPAGVSNE